MCLYKTLFSIYISTLRLQKASFSSTSNNEPNSLHPNFITGFVDGEGCFQISAPLLFPPGALARIFINNKNL
jgi:hypothetical protein